MKKYLLILTLAFVGCKQFQIVDYDKSIIVGYTYNLCLRTSHIQYPSDNPFKESQSVITERKATVIVEEKRSGYVKYCWDYDYGKPDHTSFSRNYEDFMYLVNGCK